MDTNDDDQYEDEENLSYREEGDYNEVGNALFRSEDNENSNGKDIQDNDEVLEFNDNIFDEYIDASSEEIESDTETVQSDDIDLTDVHNHSEDDDPYMEEYLCDNHFSVENVDERVSKLERYKVQIKLLKILNDEGICPKISTLSCIG